MTGCYLVSADKTFCDSKTSKSKLGSGHYEFKSQARKFIKIKIEKDGKGFLQSPYKNSNTVYPLELSFCKSKIDFDQELLNMTIHLKDGIQHVAFRWELDSKDQLSKLNLFPFVVEERKEKNSDKKISLESQFPELEFKFDDSRLIQAKKVSQKFMEFYEEKLITKNDGAFVLEKTDEVHDLSAQPVAIK